VGVVVCACDPSYLQLRLAWTKSKTLPEKYPKAKRTEGVAQEVQCLTGKRKALTANPSAAKTKKQKPHRVKGSHQHMHV
jgi:hypothetical protein